MTTVGQWLAAHADLHRTDRDALLCHGAGLTRARILAFPDDPLGPEQLHRLDCWTRRRRRGEPVAYIVGRREFWGLDLELSAAVLIPRPDTELLVEVALEKIDELAPRTVARVLELGTGSGAVAIAVACSRPGTPVTASDVCPEALAVAAANARRHGLDVSWVHGDWFAPIGGRFEVIVSNPPYVAEGDPHLEALGWEPRQALIAGADGLDAIRAVVAGAPGHLVPGGWLALEHGWDQGEAVRALLAARGFTRVESRRDLGDRDRVTLGRWPGDDHEP